MDGTVFRCRQRFCLALGHAVGYLSGGLDPSGVKLDGS